VAGSTYPDRDEWASCFTCHRRRRRSDCVARAARPTRGWVRRPQAGGPSREITGQKRPALNQPDCGSGSEIPARRTTRVRSCTSISGVAQGLRRGRPQAGHRRPRHCQASRSVTTLLTRLARVSAALAPSTAMTCRRRAGSGLVVQRGREVLGHHQLTRRGVERQVHQQHLVPGLYPGGRTVLCADQHQVHPLHARACAPPAGNSSEGLSAVH